MFARFVVFSTTTLSIFVTTLAMFATSATFATTDSAGWS
jgi:hypothetical protein